MAVAEPLLGLLAALVLAASAAGTWQALRSARQPPEAGTTSPQPFATVIVPCRGEHPGFAANAKALASQEYATHEVLFIFDGTQEPCLPEVERLAKEKPHVRVVFTDPAVARQPWASGKIPAQLTGVERAAPACDVLVFADADARPTPRWLAALVAPLADPRVGGVTGYRWYLPATRPTFWTALRDAWNAVGLEAMTLPRLRFLWGGSMAVRRADFQRSEVRRYWRTLVSEDVGLTRAVRDLGLGLSFAPGALVASVEDWSGPQVREWMLRQSALTRAAMPRLFAFAFGVYVLTLVLLAAGLVMVAAWPSLPAGLAGLALLAPTASAVPRALARERLARRVLGRQAERPRGQRALQVVLALAMPVVMLLTLGRVVRWTHVQWRGRRYALQSGRAP